MEFTGQQDKVIRSPLERHIKVPAVAGSGKSTVLCARIGMLINHGVVISRILILMFNKAAKDEFTDKLKRMLPNGDIPEVRTFHSLGMKYYKQFVEEGWLPKRELKTSAYVLSEYCKHAMTRALAEYGDHKGLSRSEVDDFSSFVDLVKSETSSPEQVFKTYTYKKEYRYFILAFDLFEQDRKANNVRFFSDLIYDPVQVLMDNDQAREAVSGGDFDQILLDEYQDINSISQYLIKVIAGKTAKVTCVGDSDQTIYEFRGSKPYYIIKGFDMDFGNPTTHPLTWSFRYGHVLSLFADHIILNNTQREDTLCLSGPGTPRTQIELFKTGNPHPVVQALEEWKTSGRCIKEAGVLVRLFSMSVPVELALLSTGISYKLEGHDTVFNLKEINALIGVLKLAHGVLFTGDHRTDTKNVHDLLSVPLIGMKTDVLLKVCDQIVQSPSNAGHYLMKAAERLQPFQKQAISERVSLWEFIVKMGKQSPVDILNYYIKTTDLFEQFRKLSAREQDAVNQIVMVEGFLEYISQKGMDLSQLLDHLHALYIQENKTDNPNADFVTITSIHRSKGLEWPLILLPGLEDGRFPYFKVANGKRPRLSDIESERRLFYVAATRAREKLVLCIPDDKEYLGWLKAKKSGYPNTIDVQKGKVSRFVYEGNVLHCMELGNAIHDGIELKKRFYCDNPYISNRYLKGIKSVARVAANEDKAS